MFDNIDWDRDPTSEHDYEPIHGPGCQCNPDSAIKVQFLRVILNFCDRDGDNLRNKALLLSKRERQAVKPWLGAFPFTRRHLFSLPSASQYEGNRARQQDLRPSNARQLQNPTSTSSSSSSSSSSPSSSSAAPPSPSTVPRRVSSSPHRRPQLPPSSTPEGVWHALESVDQIFDTGIPEALTDVGLLTKVVRSLMDSSVDNHYRFWMASCIEAFLRGAEPAFQVFVAKTGLMKALLSEIMQEGKHCAGSLQTAFDLLGEMLKFNKECFRMMDSMLNDFEFDLLLSTLATNLVDSNVFLRAVILSLDHFDQEDAYNNNLPPGVTNTSTTTTTSSSGDGITHSTASFIQPSTSDSDRSSRTCMRLRRFLEKERLNLLSDLMRVVSIDDITQENICCLNTAFIFFIIANRNHNNKVKSTIKALRDYEVNRLNNPGCLTSNFRSLLWFWLQYYQNRRKDCMGLEYSSRIQFSEWMCTFDLLSRELGECGPPQPSRPRRAR
eukprot:TRINITY_DN2450_c0_g1_i1.p1 TRINITY_DN2450_c0_g1~~TRINITY_DN2450_c0_g1_i1.p1  ORF type:complete len:574 (+),score=124.23 TRINITY_DN2450_c0_g1_i1:237-1724(+)